jgi:hypothetical protein
MMATNKVQTRGEGTTIEVQLYHPGQAWVRSSLPVTSSRGATNVATNRLSEALTHGIVAECDTKRTGFFEITINNTWFYFHVFEGLGRVYLVTSKEFSAL